MTIDVDDPAHVVFLAGLGEREAVRVDAIIETDVGLGLLSDRACGPTRHRAPGLDLRGLQPYEGM